VDAGFQVRHIRSLPPMSFVLTDKEIGVTIEKMEGGKLVQVFYSVMNRNMSSTLLLFLRNYGKMESMLRLE